MTSSFSYTTWPPNFTPTQLDQLTHLATTSALSNGLLYLPPCPPGHHQPTHPASAIHAPFSLLPAPIPRKLFEKALRLQRAYNVLYARIAMDEEFLDRVMGAREGVGRVDEFIGQLWRGWKAVREEEGGLVQKVQLGLFRSDYMLHAQEGALELKQVEFNTISVSFGCLSEKVAALHRYVLKATNYYDASPHLRIENFPPNETIKGLAEGLAAGHRAYGVEDAQILFVVQPDERNVFDQRLLEYELLERHAIKSHRQTLTQLLTSASVDKRTRVLRVSSSSPSPNTTTTSPPLSPSTPNTTPTPTTPTQEISIIYYRAGYTPTEYPSPAYFSLRFSLERSRAIKCPSLALQLAGGKKVQEVLCREGEWGVERFMGEGEFMGEDEGKGEGGVGVSELRGSWMRMWGLDMEEAEGEGTSFPSSSSSSPSSSSSTHSQTHTHEPLGTTLARLHAPHLVLKPQREGGGNNVYKGDIDAFLDGLNVDVDVDGEGVGEGEGEEGEERKEGEGEGTGEGKGKEGKGEGKGEKGKGKKPNEREAWIAMELIESPVVGGWLVRAGGSGAGAGGAGEAKVDKGGEGEGVRGGEAGPVRAETISELGVFGWVLFGGGSGSGSGGGGGANTDTDTNSNTTTHTNSITNSGHDADSNANAQAPQTHPHQEGRIQAQDTVGWLVRTKGRESDEGGVATGFSVLDSVVVVD